MPRNKRPDLTIKRHRLLRRCRIGLLGGSFNPAHEGHLHISEQAMRALRLDEIWWLVAPANPFKDQRSLAPYERRVQQAVALTAHHPYIHVSDLENVIHSFRTVKTLRHLKKHMAHIDLVWIAGMDIVHHFHHWENAADIVKTIPLAFFERPPLHQGTRRSALTQFAHIPQKRNAGSARHSLKAPRILVFRRRHTVNQSATALRNGASGATKG